MRMKTGTVPARPIASIMTRVKLIVKQYVRFSELHSTIVNSKLTGVNEEDLLRIATALFNDKKIKDPTEDIVNSFKFLHAWLFLQFHENFLAGTGADNSKQSTAGGVGSSVEDCDINATAKDSADAEKEGKDSEGE